MTETPYGALIADLLDETAALDQLVADLDHAGWARPTPAEGWTIADQVSHLAGFDEAARRSMVDPDGFSADLADRMATGRDPIAEYTEIGRTKSPAELLAWWRDGRVALAATAAQVDPKTRVPWYGPPMSAMSAVTARVMEAWAHGQDVRDTLGIEPLVSRRLRHVAHIGVGARAFDFALNGLEAPSEPVDVALTAPDGSIWSWGPGDAASRVSGDAIDFCLLVTQRRHLDDVRLEIVGEAATEWMSIAQAFAGAPGGGRSAGQFD